MVLEPQDSVRLIPEQVASVVDDIDLAWLPEDAQGFDLLLLGAPLVIVTNASDIAISVEEIVPAWLRPYDTLSHQSLFHVGRCRLISRCRLNQALAARRRNQAPAQPLHLVGCDASNVDRFPTKARERSRHRLGLAAGECGSGSKPLNFLVFLQTPDS